MAFWMVEEWFGFSLREDVPLAIYWIFAGLAVACYRMADSRDGGAPAGSDPLVVEGVGPCMRLGDSREYRVSMPASASLAHAPRPARPRNDTDPDRTGTDHSAMSSVERWPRGAGDASNGGWTNSSSELVGGWPE